MSYFRAGVDITTHTLSPSKSALLTLQSSSLLWNKHQVCEQMLLTFVGNQILQLWQ